MGQHIQESHAHVGSDSIAIYTGRTWLADQYSQGTVLAASPHTGASAVVRTTEIVSRRRPGDRRRHLSLGVQHDVDGEAEWEHCDDADRRLYHRGLPRFDITDYDGQGAPAAGQLDNWSAGTID